MDTGHVAALAAKHRDQLAAAQAVAATRSAPTPQQIRLQKFASLIAQLDCLSREYAGAYNAAFGAERLTVKNHDRGINVESSGVHDSAFRLTWDPHKGMLEHAVVCVGEHIDKLRVDVDERAEMFFIALDGDPLNADDFMTSVLDRLTTTAANTQCQRL